VDNLDIKMARAFLSLTIDEFRNEIEETRKHYLTNKEFSLEERWQLYLLIRPFLKIDGVYWTSDVLNSDREVSWYDDFYLERGETQELDEDFVKRALQKFSVDENSLKEEILEYATKEGYRGFENDW
jgi:hypothetical protein